MSARNPAAPQQKAVSGVNIARLCKPHQFGRQLGRICGSIANIVFFIRNLNTHGRCRKQRTVTCICRDQPAGDTCFKQCRHKKALYRRQIASDDLHPACTVCIHCRIRNRTCQYYCRQVFSFRRKPAFCKQQHQCRNREDNFPAGNKQKPDRIHSVCIRTRLPFGKTKNPLVKIVCEHKQQQAHRGNAEQQCPSGKPVLLCFSER